MINFYVQPEISAHNSALSISLCVRMGSINGFIVDWTRYLSYFHVINQSGNALHSSQLDEVFNISKRPLTDLHYIFKK